jgi:hypothetical protein
MKKTTAVLALLLTVLFAALVSAKPPDQPKMQAAKADLLAARAELMQAEHNKGGHRTNAVAFINQALTNVNRGISFAQKHNHASVTIPFDQPHMERALDHLKDARNNLDQATPDKGGFRAKAIDLVNKAIDQVKLGIAAGSN